MINKSTRTLIAGQARLEQEKTLRGIPVYIDSISPDQTRVRVGLIVGDEGRTDTIETRIILTPSINGPINKDNFIGLLHGDPKSPIGVQLIPIDYPRPLLRSGVSTALYGQNGNKQYTAVEGVEEQPPTDNIEQRINNSHYPVGQMVVIKPFKPLPKGHVGRNPVIPESPGVLIDSDSAYMTVDEDELRLVADQNNALIINSQAGLSIKGKVNIGSSIQDVRVGGAWKLNPMMMFQIPSSAVTPIPTLIYDPPGTNLVQGLSGILGQIKALASLL